MDTDRAASTSAAHIDIRRHDTVLFARDVVITDEAPPQPDPSVTDLARRLQDAGIEVAVYSANPGTAQILDSAGIGDLFALQADSPTTPARDHAGAVPRTVIVDNTEEGIATGRRIGADLVIGLSRTPDVAALRRAGADVVIGDVTAIDIRTGFHRLAHIPEALTSRHQLTARLRDRMPVVMLVFDGAIAQPTPDPPVADGAVASHAAELIDGVREQIIRVARACPVAVISSRDADDLRTRVGVDGIWFAGHDGRRLLGPDGDYHDADPSTAADWDRGRALGWLLEHHGVDGDRLPIYVGGPADEQAFDAMPPESISVAVRHPGDDDRCSAAEFTVADPDDVRELLERLADLLGSARDTVAPPDSPWTVVYEGYDPATEKLRESLCTIGNGVFATRCASPDARAGAVHYPGTYAAGVFNRLADQIDGHTIDNESMVNLPNWLSLTFRIDDGPWFDIDTADLLDYRQALDVRRAILHRHFRFRDDAGRVVEVSERRFVAMHLPHACALETTITPLGWSGRVEFRSLLDGAVTNSLVDRYRDLASTHLDPVASVALPDDAVVLAVQTNQSRVTVAMAARNTLWHGQEPLNGEYELVRENDGAGDRIGHDIAVDVTDGRPVTLEKMVTVFTGRDPAISEPADEAARWLRRLGRFDDLLDGHVLRWGTLWDRFDIEFDGHGDALRIVRFHLLHVLQTLSPNTTDLDVGVPARGLNGEAYRGHIFWDELLVFPVLNLRLPTVTRSLLHYRYRRMREAQAAATEDGQQGAMFPWQSGSDGREESQQLHLNPDSGRWNPDPSRRQIHIGIAIAYNVWQYYQVTGDLEFLVDCGAEMLVEIARYYAGLSSFDATLDRYAIRGVIGPDEFHGGYPDKPYDGVDNNAYTNGMAVWVLRRAAEALTLLPLQVRSDLTQRLGLHAQETTRWDDITRRMFVAFHDGVISQFEGYEALAELDWEAYRAKYGNIARLDRILEAEGDDVNAYRVSKQADALMLFYVLSADEVRELLERLGYQLSDDDVRRTVNYYLARTSHGSTLSRLVHSWVLARNNRAQAMEFFDDVLRSDINDIQGGTTPEGIHLGAMAGSVDLLQRCFTGLETRGNRLILRPNWPESLGALEFSMFYRGHRLRLRVSGTQVQVTAAEGAQAPIVVECRGQVAELRPGGVVRLG